MTEYQARAAVVGLLLLLVVVVAVALPRAAAHAFNWPNGGTLTEHVTVERPDGGHEVFPARCKVFEDGSARCPDWDGNPGAEVSIEKLVAAHERAKAMAASLSAELRALANQIAEVSP